MASVRPPFSGAFAAASRPPLLFVAFDVAHVAAPALHGSHGGVGFTLGDLFISAVGPAVAPRGTTRAGLALAGFGR